MKVLCFVQCLADKISSVLHLCVIANGEAALADGAISGHP